MLRQVNPPQADLSQVLPRTTCHPVQPPLSRFAVPQRINPSAYLAASAAEGDGSATAAASAAPAGAVASDPAAAGVATDSLALGEHETACISQELQTGALHDGVHALHFGLQQRCFWTFTLCVEQQFFARPPASAAPPVTRTKQHATATSISFFSITHSTLRENRLKGSDKTGAGNLSASLSRVPRTPAEASLGFARRCNVAGDVIGR